jgi:pyruvate/2-oxoglutarate dehydrogenase complex dihydrolipoamide dehydrogenase (E3) component
MKKFDAIIIGSGQAGTPLAFKLASNDYKVAFIEKNKVGGTCLNVGCTPTKAYVASARRMWDISQAESLGVEINGAGKINLRKVKERKDNLIQKSVDGILKGVEDTKNISFFQGEANFSGKNSVEVNGEGLTAKEIYINVGGRSIVPEGFQDLPYLDNTSILELTELPKHLIIVGGSYIGLEFGQMFRRFGSEVTIIERGDRLIKKEDPEVSESIHDFLKEEGINFHFNSTCISGEKTTDGIRVKINSDDKQQIKGSHLLLAVGRQPNTDSLKLEKAGIETDQRGYISVNDYLETSAKGIFALGDCNGRGAFTHTAYNDYEIIAENKFEEKDRKLSDRIVTYGLFVDPPLGRAGLTIQQAKEQGYSIKVAQRPMSKVARAKEKGETNGFMQIIINSKNDQILGACVLGVGGDEIISSILNMMYAKAPYTIIRDSVQPHPTISELIPTMLESLKD